MSRVRRTEQAEVDLLEIAFYIAQDDVNSAHRFLERIDRQCRLIAQSPEIGRRRDELSPGLRSFPFGNYMIFYRHTQHIEVIRVLHAARDIENIFGVWV